MQRVALVLGFLASAPAMMGMAGTSTAWADEAPNTARVPFSDESIYVAEKRPYTKRGHLELTPTFGVTLNNRYESAIAGILGVTYHIRENVGIEVIGGYAASRYTDAVEEILTKESKQPPNAELKWMNGFVGGDVQWAPFYGKLRLIPGILGDFDFYIAVGFAAVWTSNPCKPQQTYKAGGTGLVADGTGVQGISGICPDSPNNVLPADVRFAGNFGAGFRIFFTNYLGVRLEIRDLVYSDVVDSLPTPTSQEVTTTIRHNVFLLMGLSFLI
jgi:outer membrane beta-barrel protein